MLADFSLVLTHMHTYHFVVNNLACTFSEDQAIFKTEPGKAHDRKQLRHTCSKMADFRRPIIAGPERVATYTGAAIALNNFLRTTESSVYCPPGFVDCEDGLGNVNRGNWRGEESTVLQSVSRVGSNRCV